MSEQALKEFNDYVEIDETGDHYCPDSNRGLSAGTVTAIRQALANAPARDSAFDVQAGGDHYKDRAIQPFHFVRRNNIPHAEGECIYKLLRWREKGGIADLEKVIHTVQLIIEEERNHGNGLVQTGKQ